MKRSILLLISISFGFAQFIGPGPHTLFNDSVCGGTGTYTSGYFTLAPSFFYAGLWLKARLQPGHETEDVCLNVYFKNAMSPIDTFAYPVDSAGQPKDHIIFTITDTLWYIRSIRFPVSKYGKIYVQGFGTNSDSVRVTGKIYLIGR